MSYEPWPRLEKRTRLMIAAFGALAWLAAVPAGFTVLLMFGFHGRLDAWDERVALIAIPLLPLLLFLLGLACFLCFSRRGLLIVRALAAASALDFVLLAVSFYSMTRPTPLPPGLITPAPPVTNRVMEAGPGPVQVGIACSATSNECWTIRYENGREVSRKRSTGSRPRP
jgi:hypothetical protein